MFNDSGHPILEAKPSDAIQITGWKELPNVGDEMLEVENDKVLQEILKFREKERNETLAKQHKAVADQRLQEHLIVIFSECRMYTLIIYESTTYISHYYRNIETC